MAKTWEPQELNPDIDVGELASKFDHTFQWTPAHLKGSELEKLRAIGDPLADGALPHLAGPDSVDRLLDLVATSDCPASVFEFYEQVNTEPDWICHEQIRRGQELFWSYQPLCMATLLNASLIGGFGARRIVSTLRCTNYLGREDTARRRLMETALMVCDVMSFDMLRPGNYGWRSAVNVRLMHAQVRRHVLRLPSYNSKEDGIPVNQEDMLSTLIVFSATVIFSLRRMGVNVTEEQAEDYIAAWRYIGYLLGITELHFFKSYARVIALYESVMMHLLDPDETCAQLAHNVLMSCSYKAPMHTTFHGSVAMTRFLLGHDWADRLSLPRAPIHSLLVPYRIAFLRTAISFLVVVRKEWLMKRFQSYSYRAINQVLQDKRPTYQLQTLPDDKPSQIPRFLLASDTITLILFTTLFGFILLTIIIPLSQLSLHHLFKLSL
ncbi:hypothetical protein DSO57_1026935 [Entomophthora muscae]|uniref:Uncharacterized protein n=1 Tax=Entomophthora muscae TaxID=34485 RepID=A0ACC2SEL5_9FUNG|nr:hypothetical protein DSO57_1026935 [Entomophthora muscae]